MWAACVLLSTIFPVGAKSARSLTVIRMLAEPQQLRILIVDDNRIDREIYKRCFKEIATPSFEFTEAESAAAAIEVAKTGRPDCILLDYCLPDMNGLEVLA